MNKNQELHELLGRCTQVADYAADPRLVLEAMKERGKLTEFLYHIYRVIDLTNYPEDLETLVDLILDKTGKMADLAIEFLRGRNDDTDKEG